TAPGPKVAVLSLLGRLFMKPPTDCPFKAADRVLAQLPHDVKIIVVDVHAEATSEKVALGWYLDGRISLLFGTHTHVPTADERVLPGGTAYITDLGMTGPYDSVLGRRKDRVIRNLLTAIPTQFDVAVDDPRLSGIVVRVDAATGKALHVERVQVCATAPTTAEQGDNDD
ncbi:MAG: YmdB family metallophosphoesterase, partial [Phycisphaerae bacterium]